MTLSIQIIAALSLPLYRDIRDKLSSFYIFNMIDEILQPEVKSEQPASQSTVSSVKRRSTFTPARFSVRGLRKHPGIQIGRNPRVIG